MGHQGWENAKSLALPQFDSCQQIPSEHYSGPRSVLGVRKCALRREEWLCQQGLGVDAQGQLLGPSYNIAPEEKGISAREGIRGAFFSRDREYDDLWCVFIKGWIWMEQSAFQGFRVPRRQTLQQNHQTSLPKPVMPAGDQLGNLGSWIQKPKLGCWVDYVPDSWSRSALWKRRWIFNSPGEDLSLQKSWFGKPKHKKKTLERNLPLLNPPER